MERAKFVVLGLPTWALVDVTWALLSQLAAHLPEEYNISGMMLLMRMFIMLIDFVVQFILYWLLLWGISCHWW
jgi:hypothetical protein